MKNGNWIALHKELCYFLPHDRPYTLLEAMFSYTLDIDKGKDGTIAGYSKQWGWSRCKVRRFVSELKTGARQVSDRDKTGTRHHISLKINNLHEAKDTLKTPLRQALDRDSYTTIKPKPKPNPKPKDKKNIYGEFKNVKLTEDEHKKLSDKFNGTLKDKIETLSGYKKSKGVSYKDDYATILNWARKEEKEGKKRGFQTQEERNTAAMDEYLNGDVKEIDITP